MMALSQIGAWWLTHGLGLLLSTAVLLVAAELASKALSGTVGASTRIWLYVPVLLRVAIPLDVAPSAPTTELLPALTLPPLAVEGATALPTGIPALALGVGILYIAGLGATVWPALAGWRAIHQARRASRPATLHPWLTTVVHPQDGPLVYGVLRPVVIVPRALVTHPGLRHVLAHEAAHVTRGDLWLRWGLIAARAVLWPVIPVWLAVSRIERLTEIATDARATRGASYEERRAYGEVLVSLAGPAGLLPARMSSFPTLKERIMNLRRPTPSSPFRMALGGLVAAGLAGAACLEAEPALKSEPDPARRPTTIEGAIDETQIDQAIRENMSSILRCYQVQLAATPGIAGEVVFDFTITAEGQVRGVQIADNTMPSAAVAECTADVLQGVVFPEPTDGGTVQVRYPFVFEPG